MLRKTLASILILVFFSLQYGKMASYWYCKWQAEQQQLKDCGCETHLEELFADSGLHDAPLNLTKAPFSEYIVVNTILIESPEYSVQTYFKGLSSDLFPDPSIDSDLRPPIV